jgi:hypothetical protein
VYAPHAQQYDSGSRFNDAAEWSRSATDETAVDILEPLHFAANSYREAALDHMRLLHATDQFMASSKDGVLAWVTVSIVLRLTSTRGRTNIELARQMGVCGSVLDRSIARFRREAGIKAGDNRPLGLPVTHG